VGEASDPVGGGRASSLASRWPSRSRCWSGLSPPQREW